MNSKCSVTSVGDVGYSIMKSIEFRFRNITVKYHYIFFHSQYTMKGL